VIAWGLVIKKAASVQLAIFWSKHLRAHWWLFEHHRVIKFLGHPYRTRRKTWLAELSRTQRRILEYDVELWRTPKKPIAEPIMRQIFSILASAAVLLSVTLSEGKSVTGDRVLVLLDDLEAANSYTKFWHSLEGTHNIRVQLPVYKPCLIIFSWNIYSERQFHITFSTPQNQSDVLIAMAKRHYDHVVHFAPNSKGMFSIPAPLSIATCLYWI
jgi:hypothetical protein